MKTCWSLQLLKTTRNPLPVTSMTIRSPQSVLMLPSFLAWDSTEFAHMSGTQNLLYLQSTFSYSKASSLVMNPVSK